MGAWGMKSFENDEASDWLYGLENAEGIKLLKQTLMQVVGNGASLDVPDCSNALAAAEVVAALKGSPASDLPETAAKWAKANSSAPLDGLVDNAIMAVTKVKNGSELHESWKISGALDGWLASVNDLEQRLVS